MTTKNDCTGCQSRDAEIGGLCRWCERERVERLARIRTPACCRSAHAAGEPCAEHDLGDESEDREMGEAKAALIDAPHDSPAMSNYLDSRYGPSPLTKEKS